MKKDSVFISPVYLFVSPVSYLVLLLGMFFYANVFGWDNSHKQWFQIGSIVLEVLVIVFAFIPFLNIRLFWLHYKTHAKSHRFLVPVGLIVNSLILVSMAFAAYLFLREI
ncbi:MAG: hypothetical protein JWO30_2028 [Fibrobacteres bacterium]|nr:hypothetical protein [Fibrobacterota bacterium]